MSEHVIVDSSVAVKWFKRDAEAHVPAALDLLERHRDEALILAAPTLLRLEVLNALWAAQLPGELLRAVAEDLDGFRLAWFEVDGTLAAESAAIAAREGLTLYDAAFVALAVALDADLVTADARLAQTKACRVRQLESAPEAR